MTIRDIERDLLRHPLILGEMGIQIQLGLPWLDSRGRSLCLYYKPHREVYKDEMLWIYEARYELGIVYPSRHIIRFVNLYFEGDCNRTEPVCGIKGKWMIEEGRRYLDFLYLECGRVLDAWGEESIGEETGKEQDTADDTGTKTEADKMFVLLRYQALYKETIARLGLTALYGEVR